MVKLLVSLPSDARVQGSNLSLVRTVLRSQGPVGPVQGFKVVAQ